MMNTEQFERVIDEQLNACVSTLSVKAKEYATSDRLHNFKVAAQLQDCTPMTALAGMMSKHTVSVYDLIRDHEEGKPISRSMWDEKIGDSINYLLLLTALIEEEEEERKAKEVGACDETETTQDKTTCVVRGNADVPDVSIGVGSCI